MMEFAFVCVFLFLVLVPGFLLITHIGLYRQQLLFTITLSLACFAGMVSLGRYRGIGPELLAYSYLVLCAALLINLLLFRRQALKGQLDAIKRAFSARAWRVGLITVVIGYCGWYWYVGPYTEVPADLYYHLEYLKGHFTTMQHGSLGVHLDLWSVLAQRAGFWYALVAFAAYLSDSPLISILFPGMMITGLLFISAVYLFSHRLFQPLGLSQVQVSVAAVLSCFFVVAQMGVTVFSFIRYYSMAPVILNFIVFLAAMVCLMDGLTNGRIDDLADKAEKDKFPRIALMFVICFFAALIVHNQEGLFILIMLVTTIGWVFVERYGLLIQGKLKQLLILVVLAALLFGLMLGGLVTFFDHASIPVSPDGKVVGLPVAIPGFGPLHILNPYYQFSEVVTVWGGIVIALFLFRFGLFRRQPILVAAMLAPFITVFNPAFVDIYLRIEGDFSLWRLCFLFPVYYVAAVFIVHSATKFPSYGAVKRNLMGLVIAALLVLPTSNSISHSFNHYLRITNHTVPKKTVITTGRICWIGSMTLRASNIS